MAAVMSRNDVGEGGRTKRRHVGQKQSHWCTSPLSLDEKSRKSIGNKDLTLLSTGLLFQQTCTASGHCAGHLLLSFLFGSFSCLVALKIAIFVERPLFSALMVAVFLSQARTLSHTSASAEEGVTVLSFDDCRHYKTAQCLVKKRKPTPHPHPTQSHLSSLILFFRTVKKTPLLAPTFLLFSFSFPLSPRFRLAILLPTPSPFSYQGQKRPQEWTLKSSYRTGPQKLKKIHGS